MELAETAADTLAATYFDGVTAKAQAVTLRLVGGDLVLTGEGIKRSIRAADVQWPAGQRASGAQWRSSTGAIQFFVIRFVV